MNKLQITFIGGNHDGTILQFHSGEFPAVHYFKSEPIPEKYILVRTSRTDGQEFNFYRHESLSFHDCAVRFPEIIGYEILSGIDP
jgi:hypothetical protein